MKFLQKILDGFKKPERNTQLGRNDVCWCGSGKKYKRCHMTEDSLERSRKLADASFPKQKGM